MKKYLQMSSAAVMIGALRVNISYSDCNWIIILNIPIKFALTGPEVIKKIHPSMKFFLLIKVKMQTVVGILIFMSRKVVGILTFMSRKSSILGLSKPEKG